MLPLCFCVVVFVGLMHIWYAWGTSPEGLLGASIASGVFLMAAIGLVIEPALHVCAQ